MHWFLCTVDFFGRGPHLHINWHTSELWQHNWSLPNSDFLVHTNVQYNIHLILSKWVPCFDCIQHKTLGKLYAKIFQSLRRTKRSVLVSDQICCTNNTNVNLLFHECPYFPQNSHSVSLTSLHIFKQIGINWFVGITCGVNITSVICTW